MFKKIITNAQWATIAPLLPAEPLDGQPANRDFLEGFVWLWSEGRLWQDWPKKLGPYLTAFYRVTHWARQGLLAKLTDHFPDGSDAKEALQSAAQEVAGNLAPLTEQEWATYAPLLPPAPTTAEEPDNRKFLQELLWHLGTGLMWECWPTELGSPKHAQARTLAWEEAGVFKRLATIIPAGTKHSKTMKEVVKYGVKALSYGPVGRA